MTSTVNQIPGSNMWRTVSLEEARRHRLYGFGGWLGFISAVGAFGVYMDIKNAVVGWALLDDFGRLTPLVPLLYKIMLVTVRVGVDIALPLLWVMRANSFRKWFLILTLPANLVIAGYFIILTEFYKVADPPTYNNLINFLPNLVAPVLEGIAGCALLYAYMWRSRRFRINFEHRVSIDR